MPLVKIFSYAVAGVMLAVFVVIVLGRALVWELARRDYQVPYSRLCGKPIEPGIPTRAVFLCRQPRGHAGACDHWPGTEVQP